MKAVRILGALIALALVAMMAPPHQSADAKTCVNVMGKVAKGGSFHKSDTCYTPGGCNCTAQKCTTILYLPGTSHKETKVEYLYAKCENNLKVNLPKGEPDAGCVGQPMASINNGVIYHGVKCNHSGGCFCSSQKCGNSFKKVSCWKAPT
jgi:hypothetical protein